MKTPFNLVRRIYEWTLSFAQKPFASLALFALAFIEASFFIIPPDALLLPMCVARPKRALWYALVCTAGSVAGAFLGYYMGVSLWEAMGVSSQCPEIAGGAWLIDHIPGLSCDKFAFVQTSYQNNAWLALFGSAFSPIPYKIFTIGAGVFKVALATLLTASICGRGARFFLVAGLVYIFGERIKDTIERHFEWVTLAATALLIGGFIALKLLMH